ncbi:uncharacterized protein LOC141665510 [Apium graveolens]|uniref:uncharacterized protein LOC141665510 n=1 Tax=Apium graveolens TaxID=4045 RepID=UPI003D79642F
MGEAPTEGVGGHSAPITAAAPTATATGAFQPLWGFRRGDTVVGSTKHAWDWSYHSVTPKDFTDVVATPDLERIKLMGAQSLASSNAYFQGAVRQAESWKRASDKADNALRRQQKKYATLEKKLKRKEEELGESNAELVVLRAEKDKAIDNYLDSEEFAQSMRIRDDSVFPGFFRIGWDTALGTSRTMLDAVSGGALWAKSYEEAYELIRMMAANEYQNPTKRLPQGKVAGILEVDIATAIVVQLKALTMKVDSLANYGVQPIMSVCEVFMDDFSIFGTSYDECLHNLDLVLKRCVETNLVLNWKMSLNGARGYHSWAQGV